MAEPFVTLYAKHVDPVDIVTSMSEAGLSTRWPRQPNAVSVLDLEGDTVPTRPSAFRDLLRSPDQESVTFQLWFSDSEDIVVTLFRAPEMTGPLAAMRVTAYLDGAPRRQGAAVADAMERFVASHSSDTVALITDLSGRTEEFDWGHSFADPSDFPLVDSLVIDVRLIPEPEGSAFAGWEQGVPTVGLARRRG